jgi:CheY-like chemotaxis protein
MATEPKSVLIVDDSETNLVLLEAVLEDEGWIVKTAASATAGMDMIKDKIPDLILLDLIMPRVDGYEMLDRLKSSEKLKRIPVIVVSAVSDAKTRQTCIEKGAQDYMPKPVDIDLLLSKVRKILNNS